MMFTLHYNVYDIIYDIIVYDIILASRGALYNTPSAHLLRFSTIP